MIISDQTKIFYAKTGQPVQVRPLQFDDASLLVDIFDHMTAESRYRRFHQPVVHVSAARKQQEAINITQADPSRNWGLIAFSDLPGRESVPVGAVRMVLTEPHRAEVAISIRDDFQNMGIGSQLMNMLAQKAKQMGVEQLAADIQNDNAAIWRVFKKLPYYVVRIPEGSYAKIAISLTTPREETG